MSVYLIAALGQQGQLGLNGGLPWRRLERDMLWFFYITTAKEPKEQAKSVIEWEGKFGFEYTLKALIWDIDSCDDNTLIMGRRTWESLPGPLARRKNIVLRHYPYHPPLHSLPDLECCAFDTALYEARVKFNSTHTFIIGGAQMYAEALRLPDLTALFLTEVQYDGEANTWWPKPSLPQWKSGTFTWYGHHPGTYGRTWVSSWITEPDRPQYRFGMWEKIK